MTYTVIVAEDEELLLTNLVQKIQKADPDFQVAGTAQTGDQALALVEKLSPDLVVTDIRMPVMDGITLLTKVREQFPFTKFIITSGFSDFEYAKKPHFKGFWLSLNQLIQRSLKKLSPRSNRNFRLPEMITKRCLMPGLLP